MTRIVKIKSVGGPRHDSRKVDAEALAGSTSSDAVSCKDWVAATTCYQLTHTAPDSIEIGECALAVSDPDGNVVVWISTANVANVSDAKIARSCIYGAADLFDRRIKNAQRIAAAWSILHKEFGKVISPLELLAAADLDSRTTLDPTQ